MVRQEIRIGTQLQLVPETFTEGDEKKGPHKAMTGTVVYIHPKHRFFDAEFIVNGVKIRESFPWPQVRRP